MKGRISLQHPIVSPPARPAQFDLDNTEAGLQRVEQLLIPSLTPAQRLFDVPAASDLGERMEDASNAAGLVPHRLEAAREEPRLFDTARRSQPNRVLIEDDHLARKHAIGDGTEKILVSLAPVLGSRSSEGCRMPLARDRHVSIIVELYALWTPEYRYGTR